MPYLFAFVKTLPHHRQGSTPSSEKGRYFTEAVSRYGFPFGHRTHYRVSQEDRSFIFIEATFDGLPGSFDDRWLRYRIALTPRRRQAHAARRIITFWLFYASWSRKNAGYFCAFRPDDIAALTLSKVSICCCFAFDTLASRLIADINWVELLKFHRSWVTLYTMTQWAFSLCFVLALLCLVIRHGDDFEAYWRCCSSLLVIFVIVIRW